MSQAASSILGEEGLDRIRLIVSSQIARDEKLLEICRFLNAAFESYDWVGFYLRDNGKEDLILGPYIGAPTEHLRIAFGRGICGRAAVANATVNVPDVMVESNYLACNLAVRSEIGVPINKGQIFVGELDIDSHRVDRFGPDDRLFLERVANIVTDLF